MPLKTRTSSSVSNLQTYVPYSLNNETLVEDISTMFSYDVMEPLDPVDIQFTFGATQPLIKTFRFKNLTKNTNLELEFDFDRGIFQAPTTLVLLPEETKSVNLLLNVDNMQPDVTAKPVQFLVKVKNTTPTNGPLTFKASDSAQEELELTSLNSTITIYE